MASNNLSNATLPTSPASPAAVSVLSPIIPPVNVNGDAPAKEYPRVLLWNNKLWPFDPKNIVYGKPNQTGHGGYVVTLEYTLTDEKTGLKHQVPIYLQTPVMRSTFGISEKKFDNDPTARASLEINFADRGVKPAVQSFHDVMKEWDELNVQIAIKRKTEWFRDTKSLTNEVLRYLYQPMVRANQDSKGRAYPDSIRGKVKRSKEGVWEVGVFDTSRLPATVDLVQKGANLRAIMQHTGIWFMAKMWCSSFSVDQIFMSPNTRLGASFAFVECESAAGMVNSMTPSLQAPESEPVPMLVDGADEPENNGNE